MHRTRSREAFPADNAHFDRLGWRQFSRHLWKTSALSTIAIVGSGAAAAQEGVLWQPQVRAIIGADEQGTYSSLEGFIPLAQTPDSVLFLDLRLKHDFSNGTGGDVGLGFRHVVDPDLILGGYAYLNVDRFDGHQYTGATVGLEAIATNFDAHVNVHLPFGDTSETTSDTSSSLSLVGNQLLEQISTIDSRDYASWGVEGEFGVQAPVDLPKDHSLRLHVGGYHFDDVDDIAGSITGGKAGFEYKIGDVFGDSGASVVFGGEIRYDNRDDTHFAGSVRLTIPLGGAERAENDTGPELAYAVSEGLRKRANERVRGDIGVRVDNVESSSSFNRRAINAQTGSAFGLFFAADGENTLGLGTLGDPTTLDDAVTKAGVNGFVVALGGSGNLLTSDVTLQNGQTVIGGGQSVQALLFSGATQSFSFGGSDGTIGGTNPANPVISLANGNTLNGITVTGGGVGVLGNNINGATLTSVTVTGAGSHGASFTGTSTGINASDFSATNNGGSGLSIEGDGTYNFTGTTLLSGNAGDGLTITGDGTYNFQTLNTIDNADDGIDVTSNGGEFTTTAGTVSGNGDVGVIIDPIEADVVLTSIAHDGGTSGVVLDAVSGSFTVTGETTISNTSGQAIAISNSPAEIRFADITITAPGGDGLTFAGTNGPVVVGDLVITELGAGSAGLDFSGSNTTFTGQSVNITGTGAAGSIGIDLSATLGAAAITITNGGAIANVDTGVRLGIAGSLANTANANFTFGGGAIGGMTASLDARGLNPVSGSYAFGSTVFNGPQLFSSVDIIFVGSAATGAGDGSSVDDLATIGTADANAAADAIFVLVNDGAAINDADGFTLGDGQTLASFGNGAEYSLGGVPLNVTGDNVQNGVIQGDPTGNGAATLTNLGAGDTVVLGDGTVIANITISNGADGVGILGDNIDGATLTGVTVAGASLDGALFTGTSTNVSGSNFTSTGNGGAGLLIEGDGVFSFTGTTTLSGNAVDGLGIFGDGDYRFETLNLQNNAGSGLALLATTRASLSIAGGTIAGNGDTAALIVGADLDVTLNSITHDNPAAGLGGLSLADVGGSFAVTGATTIGNVGFGGILIALSTADISFGGPVLIDGVVGGNGLTVVQSGGTVSFDGAVDVSNVAGVGVLVSNSDATVTFDGPVAIADTGGEGIRLNQNTGAVSFDGATAVSRTGFSGIVVADNTGSVEFGDVAITDPGESGVDVIGVNGTISFGNIDVTGLDATCGCNAVGLNLAGSTSIFTALSLDIAGTGAAGSTGIDLSGTVGGSVTITDGGTIQDVDTGVQLGVNGVGGATANTAFVFGGGSIEGITASLDMRGLNAGSGAYSFEDTALIGPQLFDAVNVVFVGAADTGTGDGSSVNDLINADDADALTTDASTIFVLVGTAPAQTITTDADGFTLASGQSLVSFANGATVALGGPPANVTGDNVVAGAIQTDPFGAGAPTLDNAAGNTIDLADGNVISNLIATASGIAIDGTGIAGVMSTGVEILGAATGLLLDGALGTLTVNNLKIQGPVQSGIVLANTAATANFTGTTTIAGGANTGLLANNFDGTANFADLDIAGGAGTGIAILNGSGGTLSFAAPSSITNTGSAAFSVDGSTAIITYDGTITQNNAANAVHINNMTGGSATFGGLIAASTGAADAIELTGNAGATINFNQLQITTTSGVGFNAIGGGMISVAGAGSTIATQTGGILAFTDVSVGAAGVSFASLASTGIVLGDAVLLSNVDGATFNGGAVTVAGTSGVGSDGIEISGGSAATFNFASATIDNTSGYGINLNGANGAVAFTTVDIDGAGRGIDIDSPTGTVSIGGGAIGATSSPLGFGIRVANQAAASAITLTNLAVSTNGADALTIINSAGAVTMTGGSLSHSGLSDSLDIEGGAATVMVSAAISHSGTGQAVEIDGTSGVITISGDIVASGGSQLFAIGATTAPTAGDISFTGTSLTATGGGNAVIAGLGAGADIDVTAGLSIAGATGDALSISGVAGTVDFGAVTLDGSGGDGILINSNSGVLTFGTTNITSTSANTAGIRLTGTNDGDIAFDVLSVALAADNTVGVALNDVVVNGDISATDFDLTSTSRVGTVGVNLVNTTGSGSIRLGDTVVNGGQSASITDVDVGVLFSSATNVNFIFGDGENVTDVGSLIDANRPVDTIDTLPLDGDYNFLDAVLVGDTSFLQGPSYFVVDNFGTNGLGTFADPGTIAQAEASGVAVIVLVDRTLDGASDLIDLLVQTSGGGANSLDLADGQVLISLIAGQGINVASLGAIATGAPDSFKFAAFDPSTITAPTTGIDNALPTLTTGLGNTVNLAGQAGIQNVLVANTGAGDGIFGSFGVGESLTIRNSTIGGATALNISATAGATIFTFNDLTLEGTLQLDGTGGDLTVEGTGANTISAAGPALQLAALSVDTGGLNFDLVASSSGATGISADDLDLTDGDVVIVSVDLDGHTSSAITLQDIGGVGGSFTIGGGTIANTGTGAAFNIGTAATDLSGGSAAISYGGNIVTGAGATGLAVSIAELDGGSVMLSGNLVDSSSTVGGGILVQNLDNAAASVTFSGNKTIRTGASNGVTLSNNAFGTINFSGGLTIATTTGTGFAASGGGVINVAAAGSQTINTEAGTALNLNGVTLGSVNIDQIEIVDTNATGTQSAVILNATSGGTLTLGGLSTERAINDAISISNVVSGVYNFNGTTSVLSTGFFADVVSISNSAGSFSFADLDASQLTGMVLNLDASTASIAVAGGTIVKGNTGRAISVTGGDASTVNFDANVTAISGTGLLFDDADGIYGFGGVLALSGSGIGIDIINGSAGDFTFDDVTITNTAAATALGTDIALGAAAIAVDIYESAAATTNFGDLDIVSAADIGVAVRNGGTVNIGSAGDPSAINAGFGLVYYDASGTVTNAAITAGALVSPGNLSIETPAGSSFGLNGQTGVRLVADQVDTSFTIADSTIFGAAGLISTNIGAVDQEIALDRNAFSSDGGPGVYVDGFGPGGVFVTSLDSNTMDHVGVANTDEAGFVFENVVFDANLSNGVTDTVTGGVTRIGSTGARVNNLGLVLTNVTGGLSFSDLDIAAEGGIALDVVGAGLTPDAFELEILAGDIDVLDGQALRLGNATLDVMLSSVTSTNASTCCFSTGDGILLAGLAGAFEVAGTTAITGAEINGILIEDNTASIAFGTTNIAMSAGAGKSGIDFTGTNAAVTFGATTVSNVGAGQIGIDFTGTDTPAAFGVTTITGIGDATSTGIDLSSTQNERTITFETGSRIEDLGVGVELSASRTVATTANADFMFGDGEALDANLRNSQIIATVGNFTVNTVGLDSTSGRYDFDDVAFTGDANLVVAPDSATFVSQDGVVITVGEFGLSQTIDPLSLAEADALTTAGTLFAFVGPIDLAAAGFDLDAGQSITGFANGNTVSFGTIQPINVTGDLGATGGDVTGDETTINGSDTLFTLGGGNEIRHTTFDLSTGGAGSAVFAASGIAAGNDITIEGVTITGVGQGAAFNLTNVASDVFIQNNDISIAGTLLDVSGGSGDITITRGTLPGVGGAQGTLSAGRIVIASRVAGSAVTFTDQLTLSSGADDAVLLTGNTGAAVTFAGDLDITTTTGRGFVATGGGTVTIDAAGVTEIDTNGGMALFLDTVTADVEFDAVNSTNSTAHGIQLNAVSGVLTVNGGLLSGANTAGLSISNSSGTFTFANVDVVNAVTGDGMGVVISSIAGATVNFTDLDITTAGAGDDGFVVNSAGGTVNVTGNGNTINVGNAQAIDIDGGAGALANVALSINFDTVNANPDTVRSGIELDEISGTLTVVGGTINKSGIDGATIDIGGIVADSSGGNAVINIGAALNNTGTGVSRSVLIQELSGGSVTLSGNINDSGAGLSISGINNGTAATVTLSGASKIFNTGVNRAIDLGGSGGSVNGTINFTNGGLVITTTSGAGFFATAGGTINVSGAANTIATTTGTAIDLNGVAIGGNGMNFATVAVNGAATGINLASVTSAGGGIALGTANLQNVTARGVDINTALGAALSIADLDISLNNSAAVAFDLNGAALSAAVTAQDFDVTNAAAAGTTIGVDLRGTTGGQIVRLGDATVANPAFSSIAGVNTGVFLNAATNAAFTFGDGESATNQQSTISANVGIDATSAPVAGTYNFRDVVFAASPGNGFGVGDIYFVAAVATGDGSGRDASNRATLATAEAASGTEDILVLIDDGGIISAAGTNADNTLILANGEQVRGFGNGTINLALTVPSTIQLASTNIAITDPTGGGGATLTTSAASNAITLGASGNRIDGFILDGDPAGAARGIIDNGVGAAGATISNMTISNFDSFGIEIDNASGTTTLTNLSISGASGGGISFGGATGPAGTIDANNVDITNTGGAAIGVVGGTAAFDFDAASSITQGNNAAAVSVSGGHATGTFSFAGTIGAINGTGLQFDNADGTYNFTGTTTLNGGDAGIDIVNGSAGTFAFGASTTISNPTGTAFAVTGSNANVTYSGSIADNTGFAVDIDNHDAGTITFQTGTIASTGTGLVVQNSNGTSIVNFNNASIQLSTGAAAAVTLANTGGTVNFNTGGGAGLDIVTTTGTGFSAIGGGVVTVQGAGNSIGTTTGTALNLSGVTVGNGGVNGLNLASVSTNGAANGILLTTVSQGLNSTGIDILGGSIVNASTRGVDIDATSADVSIATSISTTATGRSVEVTGTGRNVAGGSQIVFSGAIDDNGLGINLDNNDQNTQGAVVTFSGGLDIDSTVNTGFNAINGGTVVVTGANNSINTTTGIALNVANTNIGTSDLNFRNISANGAASGIILNTTGSAGGLTVTGNGSTTVGGDNSGGTIQNTSGHGISLTNTRDVSLTNLSIQTTGGQGIDGTGVTNFIFANGTINNAGDASAENSINFASSTTAANVTGVVSITNSNITNTEAEGVRIVNHTGNLSNVIISGNTFSDTNDLATPGSAVVININAVAVGNAASLTRATLSNNTITTFRAGSGFVVQANSDATGAAFVTLGTAGSATDVINITGNLMDGGAFGISNQPDRFVTAAVNGTGTGNFNVSNNGTALNRIRNIDGVVIELSSFGAANVTATINNNFINANNAVASAGIGVGHSTDGFATADNGSFTTTISNNNIMGTDGQGIFVVANGSGSTGTVNAHILNNIVAAPVADAARVGIQVSSGSTGSDVTVNLEISGNITAGGTNSGTATTAPGIGLRKQGTDPSVNTFNIKGMPEASTATPAVENYVNSQNPGSASGVNFGVGGTALISAQSGFTNDTPGGFLTAAPGGVDAMGEDFWGDVLTGETLDNIVAAAIQRLAATGLTDEQLAVLNAATFEIADLGGNYLGVEDGSHITLDDNGAGRGWYVDATPLDDEEFANRTGETQLLADGTQAPAGRYDLLTTILHEFGHMLGYGDTYAVDQSSTLMYGWLTTGERRLPYVAYSPQDEYYSASVVE